MCITKAPCSTEPCSVHIDDNFLPPPPVLLYLPIAGQICWYSGYGHCHDPNSLSLNTLLGSLWMALLKVCLSCTISNTWTYDEAMHTFFGQWDYKQMHKLKFTQSKAVMWITKLSLDTSLWFG